MKEMIFNIIQLVLSVILIVVILLQQKGSGLGGIFGGSSNVYSTKRGIDKVLHYTTIVVATLFCLLSLLQVIW